MVYLLHMVNNMEVFLKNLFFSFVLRIALVIYSVIHDTLSVVKYTDVDYYVFSDAAALVYQGKSPYLRDTYRYTPILSWILVPNQCIHYTCGKFIFVICDLLVALIIFRILVKKCTSEKTLKTALFCVQIWLYNPLTVAVSSRGNAESIMALLVVGAIYYIMDNNVYSKLLGYVLLAFSIHMKIYPVTYAIPVYFYLTNNNTKNIPYYLLWIHKYLWPNKERLKFVIIFMLVLGITSLFCYYMYGMKFVEETYLYHVTRRDTRHNFSVYFYMLYLSRGAGYSKLMDLILFLPQAILLVVISFKYHEELPFCCFLNTFVFVTFNKVCTSQYFMWYICLLPLIIPKLRMSKKESLLCVAAWFLGQVVWLAPAYYLEFEGQNTFLFIWLSGLFFFIINISVVYILLKRYDASYQNELTPLNLDWIFQRSKSKIH